MYIVFDIVFTFIAVVYHLLKSLVLVFFPKKKKDVKSDIVLVTGAGNGLGRMMAVEFAKLGAVLVLWDVNEKGNIETAKMIENNDGKVFAYTCNLANKSDVYKTAAKVKLDVGKVTILINNAGIVTGKLLLECPDQMIENTFAVNVLSHFWTVKAFLPDMLQMRKGHIVTIASLAGFFGAPYLVDYSSSKAAAILFSDALTAELRASGHKFMRTTLICPFFINTGMFDGVKTRLIPILTPEMVCETTVNAILKEDRKVIIPRYLNIFRFIQSIVPVSVFDDFEVFFGDPVMNTFTGREKSN